MSQKILEKIAKWLKRERFSFMYNRKYAFIAFGSSLPESSHRIFHRIFHINGLLIVRVQLETVEINFYHNKSLYYMLIILNANTSWGKWIIDQEEETICFQITYKIDKNKLPKKDFFEMLERANTTIKNTIEYIDTYYT